MKSRKIIEENKKNPRSSSVKPSIDKQEKARCRNSKVREKGTDPRSAGCHSKHGSLLYKPDDGPSLVLASSGLLCPLSPASRLGRADCICLQHNIYTLNLCSFPLSILLLKFLLRFTAITQIHSNLSNILLSLI